MKESLEYKIIYKSLDNIGRLHCEDGPSVVFANINFKGNVKDLELKSCNITNKDITKNSYNVGFKAYFYHGILVPSPEECKNLKYPKKVWDMQEVFFHKLDKLTAQYIDLIPNIELRRIGMEKLGIAKYVEQSGFTVIHSDVDSLGNVRRAVMKEIDNGENTKQKIVGVFVTNSTPNGRFEREEKSLKKLSEYQEHDRSRIINKYKNTGSLKTIDGELYLEVVKESGKFIPDLDEKGNLVHKTYFLLCHPEGRPMIFTGKYDSEGNPILELGDPQELTCHNLVASTFQLYGDEYNVDVES